MAELMRLYNTFLGPASNALIDLGAAGTAWNNLYVQGTVSAGYLSISTVDTTIILANSGTIVGLKSTGATINSATIAVLNATATSNISYLRVTSNIRLELFNNGVSATSSGDVWYDTTRKTIMAFTNSSRLALSGVLFTQTGLGIVANNATEATLIGSGFGSTTLSPNFFVPGKTIRITASGLYETQLVPTTLNIRLRLGGLAGTVIHSTGDQTPAGGITMEWWRYITDIVCQTTGATGSVIGQSNWEHQSTATTAPLGWAMTNLGVTIDTTTALIVQFTADWGAAVAAEDSMMCTTFTLESLN